MRRPIDPAAISKLLNRSMSPPEIAKELGIKRTSVYRIMKNLEKHAPKVVALEKADKYVDCQLNMMDEYQDSLKTLNELIHALKKLMYEGDKTVFAEMQRKVESKSVEDGVETKGGKKGKKSKIEQKIERFFSQADPKVVLVQAIRAKKELLSLQVDVMKVCGDPVLIVTILKKIIEVIGRIAPDVKYQIEEALKREQLIRSIITFSSVDQADMRN